MKWKNYGLWVSLVSIVYMVFKDFGLQIDLTSWETYVTAIVGILAALGIVSNPDKGKGFFDKLPDTPAEAIEQVTDHIQNQAQPSNDQGIPQQYQLNQNPSNTQQYQEYPHQPSIAYSHQQQDPYQHIQQEYPNQEIQAQNEYQNLQINNTQSNQPSPLIIENNSQQSQEAGPFKWQLDKNARSTQPTDSMNEQTSNNKSFDRSSIHGTPAPPNEYM